jgi:hypothetical protein
MNSKLIWTNYNENCRDQKTGSARLKIKLSIALALCLPACAALADVTNDLPKFDEVYQLLRSNLKNTSETALNDAAVRGLLSQLSSNAMLVGAEAGDGASASSHRLSKSLIYDDSYVYLRVQNVESNLADEILTAYRELAATNKAKIKGVVLDLRFAGGHDFAAAAAAGNCFLDSETPLLEFGGQVIHANKNTNAITVPLAVLINARTSEAAEGLAAVLRETSTGLLLGGSTAGQASLFKDFPLSNGGKLRLAVGEIKLGDGSVFGGGVKPDIAVTINPTEEPVYWEHPYQSLTHSGAASTTGTNADLADVSSSNASGYHRFNEAQLVREQRDGADLEAAFSGREDQPDPSLKVVTDPVLARALDLLKGLAVVQKQ